MKVVGYVLGGCIALAVLQAAMQVMLLALPIILLVSLIRYPRETMGLAALLLTVGLIQHRPGTVVAVVGVILTACLIGKAIDKIAG